MIVKCDICFEDIAIVSRTFMSFPMTGAMFKSKGPFHGFTDPFPVAAHWDDFRCPYGNHRPFISDDKIMTDEGEIVLPRDGGPSLSHRITMPAGFDPTRVMVKEVVMPEAHKLPTSARWAGGEYESDKRTADIPSQAGKEEGKEEGYTCETCKKVFEKEINLKRHKKATNHG